MSAWLGRPHLISQKEINFEFPNLRLDEGRSDPNLLSPFAHNSLQAILGRRLAQHLRNVSNVAELTADQIFAIEEECEAFIKDLPPVFRMEDPHLDLDEEHPYYVFQRFQLHVVILATQLDFLKPFLTRSARDDKTSRDNELRNMGIDLGLKLIRFSTSVEWKVNSFWREIIKERNYTPHQHSICSFCSGI